MKPVHENVLSRDYKEETLLAEHPHQRLLQTSPQNASWEWGRLVWKEPLLRLLLQVWLIYRFIAGDLSLDDKIAVKADAIPPINLSPVITGAAGGWASPASAYCERALLCSCLALGSLFCLSTFFLTCPCLLISNSKSQTTTTNNSQTNNQKKPSYYNEPTTLLSSGSLFNAIISQVTSASTTVHSLTSRPYNLVFRT